MFMCIKFKIIWFIFIVVMGLVNIFFINMLVGWFVFSLLLGFYVFDKIFWFDWRNDYFVIIYFYYSFMVRKV